MIGTLLRGSLPSETERLRLERELAGVEKKLDQVLDACFSGQITQRECDRLCRHYRQTVKQLQTGWRNCGRVPSRRRMMEGY